MTVKEMEPIRRVRIGSFLFVFRALLSVAEAPAPLGDPESCVDGWRPRSGPCEGVIR
jgi:predicted exporter